MEIFHQGHERLSDESQGRQDIFMSWAAPLCQQFLLIRQWRSNDIHTWIIIKFDFSLNFLMYVDS